MSNRSNLAFCVVVFDARGPGLRRTFGPFRSGDRAHEAADKINAAANRNGAPARAGGNPAIRATVGWLHEGREVTIKNCVTDAPDPATMRRPSEPERVTS